jgi:hypothetical protein
MEMVPPAAAVSASNGPGSHLSARRRIQLFPTIQRDTGWVLVADSERYRQVARDRPTLRPPGTRARLQMLDRSSRWRLVYREEGVSLFRRAPRATPTG